MEISKGKVEMLFLNLCFGSIIFIIATAQLLDDNITNSDYRLSEKIVPQHYDIQLIFQNYDSNQHGYDQYIHHMLGICNVNISILQPTSNINLHFQHLIIRYKMTKLYDDNNVDYRPVEHRYNSETHILNLHFNKNILPGFYVLHLEYHVSDNYTENENAYLKSFKTSFVNIEKENKLQDKLLIATNFRSIEARQVFPCWDEPAFRTTFKISINHFQKHIVLSNMPVQRTRDVYRESWQCSEFKITSSISTRHVTFVITNAVRHSNLINNYVTNVWSFNVTQYTKFALNVINKILAIFWKSNIIVRPEELCHIAVPDIQHNVIGKMGLVIYNEVFFIFDEYIDPTEHKIEVARTVVHGMTHQWLDHRIRLFWWSDQWFIEAFQIFYRITILHEIFPQWRPMDLFVVQIHHECLHMDTGFHMMPLMNEVRIPSEIKSVFSIALYIKAPVLLRMLQHLITIQTFNEIIDKYLNQCLFQPTSLDYVWNMIENYVDKSKLYNNTIKDIIETWTKQSNYPTIKVERHENHVIIKPYHYYLNGYNVIYNVYNACIPITFTTENQINFNRTKPDHWLIPKYHKKITIRLDSSYWIIVNLQQTGYYRVKYDEESLRLISIYLNSDYYTNIHVLNRAQLIDDACHFWMANKLSYDKFKRLIEYLQKETDYVAWYSMFQCFRSISRFLPFEEFGSLKFDMQYILHPLLFKLKHTNIRSSNESDFYISLRKEILWWACTFDDPKCQKDANNELGKHLNNFQKNKIKPDWKAWVYCKGLTTANETTLFTIKYYLLSINTSTSQIYEYLLCNEISSFNEVLYKFYTDATLNKLNYSYIPYQFIARHAKDNINNIAAYFQIYKGIVRNETKLLLIIINHLYSKHHINKLIKFVKDELQDEKIAVDISSITNITERRLHYIKNQKSQLLKLIKIS